jgi:hypothetical protein
LIHLAETAITPAQQLDACRQLGAMLDADRAKRVPKAEVEAKEEEKRTADALLGLK